MSLLLISSIADKIIPAFGWMLLHSLWQALFFSIIAGIVLMLAKKSQATYRYNILLILFIAFIGTTAFTFLFELGKNQPIAALKPILQGNNNRTIIPALFSINIHSIKEIAKTFANYFSVNQPLIVLIWFIFFMFKSVKMYGCVIYNQHVRNRQVSAPPSLWTETVASFAEKLQINKAVILLQSGYIKMPVVIGHLKPIILIPAGLLAGLPAEQIEAILLHELAHIRRNDYFVNFLQNIAETVFFFNPGLLWISAILREERENCCDDIALRQTQNKTGFVQALISFKEYELYNAKYATAFPGKKSYLMRRVSRILTNENKTFGFGEKLFFSSSILLMMLIIATVAFGKIKDHVKIKAITMRYNTLHDSILANKNPISANGLLKSRVAQRTKKMQAGIAGIKLTSVFYTETQVTAQPKNNASANLKFAEVKQLVELATENRQPENNIKESTEVNQKQLKKQKDLTDSERADLDQIQARKDQQQALVDQKQALIDQAQAAKDQEQERKDQEQARIEQQNVNNQEQARLNDLQAKRNQEQNVRNQEQAQRNELQIKKNEEQAERNAQQAIRNKEQDKKNQEQAIRNQEQAKKNQEQAFKNSQHVQE